MIAFDGKCISGPITPTIVQLLPLSCIDLPTMFGSAPNARRQKPSLRITTGLLPRLSSSGKISLPIRGDSRSSGNKLEVIRHPTMRCASCSP